MKKMILGLVLLGGLQASAGDNYALSRVVSSGSQIATAWVLPNYGVGGDIKFAAYFSAGLEYPWIVASTLIPLGLFGGDPVAFSAGLSLVNRGLAVTTLNQVFGLDRGKAFLWVAVIDQMLANIPITGFEKFGTTKTYAALGNFLEYTPQIGPLNAGIVMAVVPLLSNWGAAASDFSEESGMRVAPALYNQWVSSDSLQHTATSALISVSSYVLAYQLMTRGQDGLSKHNLKSSWVGAAAVSFMINALVAGSEWLYNTIDP